MTRIKTEDVKLRHDLAMIGAEYAAKGLEAQAASITQALDTIERLREENERLRELETLVSEESVERLAKDIAIAFGDCFRSDVVSLRHAAMVRLGERLRNPLSSDRAALTPEESHDEN